MEQVDAILRDVTKRSTVYAHEILDPLREVVGAEDTIGVLLSVVSECGGERYLHVRDFLNPLLDLRNALKEGA